MWRMIKYNESNLELIHFRILHLLYRRKKMKNKFEKTWEKLLYLNLFLFSFIFFFQIFSLFSFPCFFPQIFQNPNEALLFWNLLPEATMLKLTYSQIAAWYAPRREWEYSWKGAPFPLTRCKSNNGSNALLFVICNICAWICMQLRLAEERREEAEARSRELEKQVKHLSHHAFYLRSW